MKRALCIVVHDVAWTTWRECVKLLAMLEQLGSPPVTFLVVPNFHGHGHIDGAHGLRRDVDRWLARGSEVALHGLLHQDDLSRPSGPVMWFARRVMTAGEGEFAALSAGQAGWRIAQGLRILGRCGWSPNGFVPPAWLASAGTNQAVARHQFSYMTTSRALVLPATGEKIFAPSLTASVRSTVRRQVSHLALGVMLEALRNVPILRVALHPADAHHPDILARWRSTLLQLLAAREPLTKSQVVMSRA
jgi:predicted deacetylase